MMNITKEYKFYTIFIDFNTSDKLYSNIIYLE